MSNRIARYVGRFAVFVLALALVSVCAHAQVTLSIGLTPGTDANGEPSYTASVSSSGGTASNVIVT